MVSLEESPTASRRASISAQVERGTQQALAQQAAAHAGRGLIEDVQEGGVGALAGEERLEQFEIAHGDGIEHHGFGAVVVGGAVEMFERGALRVAQVVQDGAGGADGRGVVGEAAAIEREQAEVFAQGAVGVVEGEDPVFEFGAEVARAWSSGRRAAGRSAAIEHFARAELFEGGVDFGGVDFGDAEFAGGDIDVGEAGAMCRCGRRRRGSCFRASAEASESVAVPGVTMRVISRLTSFLARRGIFHLVADGDAVALLDEARDVAFGGVVGDAAHGDGARLFPCCGR